MSIWNFFKSSEKMCTDISFIYQFQLSLNKISKHCLDVLSSRPASECKLVNHT